MEVIIADEATLATLAADAVEAVLRTKPDPVIGLATGSSPLAVYRDLARRHAQAGLGFDHARGFMLDEYVGIAPDHPERYRNVIAKEIAEPVEWPAHLVQGPDGGAADLRRACADYEAAIAAAGGVDIQILGIGTDGHIAFNEPGSSLASRTRVKTLTRQTREDNARFFGGDLTQVPVHCLTQGLGTIMDARHLVLLAFGQAKAQAVRELVEGPVSARWPATIIQHHPHATILLDEPAASLRELSDYYRDAAAARLP
jgi:glucosamine-6-phosphate deaminase